LSSRPGRSGQHGCPRSAIARSRRYLADRRALRRWSGRGQPEPSRPRLLLGVHAHLHSGFPIAGGRTSARFPGRRGAPARDRHHRRLLPFPKGLTDAFQPGPGGAAL